MRNNKLSLTEIRYLTTCLKGYDSNLKLTEGDFKNDGLTKRQITSNTEKFRELGFIEKKGYMIKKDKLKEVNRILKEQKKEDIERHEIWDRFLTIVIIYLIVILGVFLSISLFPLPNQIFFNQTFTLETTGFPHFPIRMSQTMLIWILIILIGILFILKRISDKIVSKR